MSAERTRSAVAADHRSIIPNIPGVPWWAAVVVAVTGTAAGFAFDAGSGKELTTAFAALYVLGCVVAILAVRQSGVFTAVIQPPLILFGAVPGAYWLFHGAKFTGLKDLLINCGYPLIERFPLMLFTSGGVLVIGIIRWLLAKVTRPAATAPAEAADAKAATSEAQPAGLASRLVSMFAGLRRESGDDDAAEKAAKPAARRTHAVGRSAKPARSARSADRNRTGKRPAASRSRHVRPPVEEPADPTVDRARRSRSQRPARPREFDAPEPPRRSRVPRDPDLRDRSSREIRRDPHARKGRPARRGSRFDPYEPIEPYESYEPSAPPEARRRPVSNGAATHHPISQVRYRGSTRGDDSRNEPPARPGRTRDPGPDSWNYDIRDARDA